MQARAEDATFNRCPGEDRTSIRLVPGEGVEPSRYFYRRILSPLRLPFRHPGVARLRRERAAENAHRHYR